MSGYLEVKISKTTRVLNPFKTWRKQWCILRPCPTKENTAVLAFHTSAGQAFNSTIVIPSGCIVCRTKSRTQKHAFGVYQKDVKKPLILLSGQTETESQMWMTKIRGVLNGKKYVGKEILLKNSFAVSLIDNDYSRECQLDGLYGVLTISSYGILISQPTSRFKMFISWSQFRDIHTCLTTNMTDHNKIFVIRTTSKFFGGGGEIYMYSTKAQRLVNAVRDFQRECGVDLTTNTIDKRCWKSDNDLYVRSANNNVSAGRRSSWCDGPSALTIDDTELIKYLDWCPKVTEFVVRDKLQDSSATTEAVHIARKFTVSMLRDTSSHSRCSIVSGIYEEIDEHISDDVPKKASNRDRFEHENMYETLTETVYATMRRPSKAYLPPPLPPRFRTESFVQSSSKLDECWSTKETLSSNGPSSHSLGSIPRCYSSSSSSTKPLSKPRSTLNVFRKRIKSDSRVVLKQTESSPAKETKTKKKSDSPQPKSKDIFKNFSVSRILMRNSKISKCEAKSCEYLDRPDSANLCSQKQCSKSTESLEDTTKMEDSIRGEDLSLLVPDHKFLSDELVDLIVAGHGDIASARLHLLENEYVCMSPKTQLEPIYTIMSPPSDANVA